MDVLTNVRDESLTRMVEGLSALIAAVKSIKQEEENFGRLSKLLLDVKEHLIKQQSQHPGGQSAVLQENFRKLEEAVNNARKAIDEYKSKSSFGRFFLSSSVCSQLNQSYKEIDYIFSLLPSNQITTAFDINSKFDDVSRRLESLVFKVEASGDAFRSSLQVASSSRRVSPVDTPQAQLIQILQYSINEPVNNSFFCPLSGQIMKDPVFVSCNHTYERKEVEEYFRVGHKFCKLCKMELASTMGKLDLKPNSTLRENISEWKQRDTRIEAERNAKEKLKEFTARISLDNVESTNQALEDLKALMMQMPSCISVTMESSCKLVQNLAALLKKNVATTSTVLRLLLLVARFSDENKERIGTKGVIKCLLKQDNENEADAIDILLELSTNNKVAQKIIDNKTSIPRLMSLVDSPSSSLAEKAHGVLKNLSMISQKEGLPTNINNTIMMAMSGYLPPFLDQFNKEISEDTRASMATELAQMLLTETAICCLKNEMFITNLGVMLSSSSPAAKLASLNCIKWLMTFDGIRSWIISNGYTIRADLLCLITDTAADKHWKQEALEILISLIEINQPLEQQCNSCLELIKTSTSEDQVILLQLLLATVKKSDAARNWLISSEKAMTCLYSSISPYKNSEVRLNAMKLISYIAGNNTIDIPLPPNPDMETAVSYIVATVTNRSSVEEISIAANIISHLPQGDRRINVMLQSSDVLEALKFQISDANKSNELLENALGALLRCMDQSNSVCLRDRVPMLVQMLSKGSPLARQRAAKILAHLARCTPDASGSSHSRSLSWSSLSPHCSLHKSSCLPPRIICLAKVGAVTPLVHMVGTVNPDASEAALTALLSLFDTGNVEIGASETLNNAAASIIIENGGVAPILAVLERGPLPVKNAAFELIQKICTHPHVTKAELCKLKAILSHLLKEETELSKKARVLIQELMRTCIW